MNNLDATKHPVLDVAADGSVTGAPRAILRAEGLAMLVAGVVGYALIGASWPMFAALFLVPDLAFLGYLAGPRAGGWAYNATHSLIGPALLAALSPSLALVWVAHVGFDRALGYGLKYGQFGATHLGRIGRR
ncbi:MAG: DUF4260 domain-containing protein [Kofleriaceae bacterium]|nr:DUF4260 domain-containing protein [Kofleriaceae bacterium]